MHISVEPSNNVRLSSLIILGVVTMKRSKRIQRVASTTRDKAHNAFMALLVLCMAVAAALIVTTLIFANAYYFDNTIDLHVIMEILKSSNI